MAHESNRESVNAAEEHKKEQEDPQENTQDVEKEQEQNVEVRPSTEQQVSAAHTLYIFKKKQLRTMLLLWNRSNLKEYEDPKIKEIERRMRVGCLIIKDVKDDGSVDRKMKEIENKKSYDPRISRKGKEKVYEPEIIYEPLLLIHFVALGLFVYIEHIAEMAMVRRSGARNWISHLEEAADIADGIIEKMKVMNDEMRRMKQRKDLKEDFVRFHKMLSDVDEIMERLDGSRNIEIVSQRDCSQLELMICKHELENCKKAVEILRSEIDRLLRKKREEQSHA